MDPASSRASGGKLTKGAIILIVAVIVIALAVIILVTVRALNRRKEQDELEAQLAALQMQANDPNTPAGERQGLWMQMSSLASRIQALRDKYGANSGSDSQTETDIFWSGNGSGICGSSGVLNKDRTLKKGVNSMEVCQLQLLLNKRGAKLPVDGKFSVATETALKQAASNRTSITLRQIPKSYWA